MQRDIPVIVDEIFTGLWRLGYISGAKMLGIEPDIACYGKLLTGGLVPLGVTLASEDVFDAFEGDSKVQPQRSRYTVTQIYIKRLCFMDTHTQRILLHAELPLQP